MSIVEEAIRGAQAAEDRPALWAALDPARSALGEDEALSTIWAEALRTSPGRPSLVAEAELILAAWPYEPALVGACCDALIRAAERRPIDEPPLDEGPASVAAGAARRCFGRLSDAAKQDPEVGGRLRAIEGNALGLMGPKRADDARAALEAALALDPRRGAWEHDLALVEKRARAFEAMLERCLRARALAGSEIPRSVLFNLGLAATAVGRIEEAADAWRALGLAVELREGALPFVDALPKVKVRVPTIGAGYTIGAIVPDRAASFEIAWAEPLSPVHGVIRSPTFRQAAADYGDVVLWDPSPVGVEQRGDEAVARMPLLGVIARGDERRFRFVALQQHAEEISRVAARMKQPEDGVVLYTLGEKVELLCSRCAAGEVLTKHEHLPPEEHRVAFGKLLVPAGIPIEEVEARLREAREASPGLSMAIPELYEALGATQEAGKHHKRWGSIERAGLAPSQAS